MDKIDLSYLEEITGGDKEIMVEMIDLFLNDTPELIEKIKKHYADEEWLNLSAEAHKLKPTLLYVGLKDLNRATEVLEEKSRKKEELSQIPTLIKRIERGFNSVIGDLKAKKQEMLS